MKIIYLTDIHGGFDRLASLLAETIADIYIIGGDIINIPFYDIDTSIDYYELQTYFNGLRRNSNKTDMIIEDFVDHLLDDSDIDSELKKKVVAYQQYTIRARRVMQQKYKVLENILSFKTSSIIYALPGNYDMDFRYTALHERDLHLHWHDFGDLKIAGYGGADVWTAGIPEMYIVKYQASIGIDDKRNEMHTFFKAIKPDIIVTHQPAHGIHDRISFKGPSGSPALRSFCDNNKVKLCLTGHIHNDWGFQCHNDTIYLNPSNFGEVLTATGEISEGGFFHEIYLENNEVKQVIFKKIYEHRIFDIAHYNLSDKKWKEEIIDKDRYNALKIQENYDMKVEKYSHIPEIELFKDIRSYYRLFQTKETENRVQEMESLVKIMKGRFIDIALDIVGSVNLGMSEKSSDIDMVLYLRCNKKCSADHDQCSYFINAKKMIADILKDKYKFEIIDCINLDLVEDSILYQNYECETTQRFVAYRSICRPINYNLIAPIEDMLNENIKFRKEMEGSIRSYFQIFVTTSQHIQSFDKYEARLKSVGIKMPDYIRNKVQEYLQR